MMKMAPSAVYAMACNMMIDAAQCEVQNQILGLTKLPNSERKNTRKD